MLYKLPIFIFPDLIKFVETLKMETIVIQTQNAEETKLVQTFLQQHKIKGRVLTDDDKEDMVLGRLMEETAYDEVVDTVQFLNKLRS